MKSDALQATSPATPPLGARLPEAARRSLAERTAADAATLHERLATYSDFTPDEAACRKLCEAPRGRWEHRLDALAAHRGRPEELRRVVLLRWGGAALCGGLAGATLQRLLLAPRLGRQAARSIGLLGSLAGALGWQRHAKQHGPWPFGALHGAAQARRDAAAQRAWEALGVESLELDVAGQLAAELKKTGADTRSATYDRGERVADAQQALAARWLQRSQAAARNHQSAELLELLQMATPAMHAQLLGSHREAVRDTLLALCAQPGGSAELSERCPLSPPLRDGLLLADKDLLVGLVEAAWARRGREAAAALLAAALRVPHWDSLAALPLATWNGLAPPSSSLGKQIIDCYRAAFDVRQPCDARPVGMMALLAAGAAEPPLSLWGVLRTKVSQRLKNQLNRARGEAGGAWVGTLVKQAADAQLLDAGPVAEEARQALLGAVKNRQFAVAEEFLQLHDLDAAWKEAFSAAAKRLEADIARGRLPEEGDGSAAPSMLRDQFKARGS